MSRIPPPECSAGVPTKAEPRRDIEALGHLAATAEGVSEECPGDARAFFPGVLFRLF